MELGTIVSFNDLLLMVETVTSMDYQDRLLLLGDRHTFVQSSLIIYQDTYDTH